MVAGFDSVVDGLVLLGACVVVGFDSVVLGLLTGCNCVAVMVYRCYYIDRWWLSDDRHGIQNGLFHRTSGIADR